MEFYETGYGKRFFDGQLPQLIKAIERVAGALEQQQGGAIEADAVERETLTAALDQYIDNLEDDLHDGSETAAGGLVVAKALRARIGGPR